MIMRIFWIFVLFYFVFCVDTASKMLVTGISGSEYCYENSPYIVQELYPVRPVHNCYQNVHTGKDFYASVYADQYHPILGEYFGRKLSYNTGVAFSLPIRGIPLQ